MYLKYWQKSHTHGTGSNAPHPSLTHQLCLMLPHRYLALTVASAGSPDPFLPPVFFPPRASPSSSCSGRMVLSSLTYPSGPTGSSSCSVCSPVASSVLMCSFHPA